MAIIIEDEDFAAALRAALAADPETAEAVVALMVEGCTQIEQFESALEFARAAPFDHSDEADFHAALNQAHASVGNLIDIFGDILELATQLDNDGGA